MKNNFNILKITRNNILTAIKNLSVEQLNRIPEGYKNNIIWNVAHNIVTQQLLIYKLSGVLPKISEEMIAMYRKGGKPSRLLNQSEIDKIKSLLIQTADWLEEDYANGMFKSFQVYPTSYNVILNSTEDAIFFNNVHEALHFGYIMAMKKII